MDVKPDSELSLCFQALYWQREREKLSPQQENRRFLSAWFIVNTSGQVEMTEQQKSKGKNASVCSCFC